MTTIYFVRHCKPDHKNPDDRNRPLTDEGIADSERVKEILSDKKIDIFITSPYKRSFDSIKKAADSYGLGILTDERLRERKCGNEGNSGYKMFRKRWADFSGKSVSLFVSSAGGNSKKCLAIMREITGEKGGTVKEEEEFTNPLKDPEKTIAQVKAFVKRIKC